VTLLITGLAAVVVVVLRLGRPEVAGRWRLGLLALVYAGACLMWCVDGLASLARGGPFLDLADRAVVGRQTWQGLSVVALGLVAWGVVLVAGRRRRSAPRRG